MTDTTEPERPVFCNQVTLACYTLAFPAIRTLVQCTKCWCNSDPSWLPRREEVGGGGRRWEAAPWPSRSYQCRLLGEEREPFVSFAISEAAAKLGKRQMFFHIFYLLLVCQNKIWTHSTLLLYTKKKRQKTAEFTKGSPFKQLTVKANKTKTLFPRWQQTCGFPWICITNFSSQVSDSAAAEDRATWGHHREEQ